MLWIAVAAAGLALVLIKFGKLLVMVKLLSWGLTGVAGVATVLLAILIFPARLFAKLFSRKQPANT